MRERGEGGVRPNQKSSSNHQQSQGGKPNQKSSSNPHPHPFPNAISTIFVYNIPLDLDKFGLRGIFSRFGAVEEASIPDSQGGKKRFGFVKFKDQIDAGKCIQSFNNRVIRGFRIWVQLARRDCVRVWQEKSKNCCSLKPRNVPIHSEFNPEGEVLDILLSKLKSSFAAEFDKLAIVRKGLESFLGKLEELFASKSLHPNDEVHPETPALAKADNPSVSPSLSKSSVKAAGFERVEDSLESVGGPSPVIGAVGSRVSEELEPVVEEESEEDPEANYESDVSAINSTSIPMVFSSSDLVTKISGEAVSCNLEDLEAKSQKGEIRVVEEGRGEVLPLESELELGSSPEQNFFSFKSKPTRRRKKSGKCRKSRVRFSHSYTSTGDKRKSSCQYNHSSQGRVKRMKCSSETPRQDQLEDPPGSVDFKSPNKEVEIAAEVGESPFPISSPIINPSSNISCKSQKEHIVEDRVDVADDFFRNRAIKTLKFGELLGVKVVKNKEGVILRTARNIRNQRRFQNYSSSEGDSQPSLAF